VQQLLPLLLPLLWPELLHHSGNNGWYSKMQAENIIEKIKYKLKG